MLSCTQLLIFFLVYAVPKKPTLTPNPTDPVEEGTPVTLTCATETSGDITYTFIKDGEEIQTGPKAIHELKTPTVKDSGAYTCSATSNGKKSLPSDKQDVVVGKNWLRTFKI